MKLTRKSNWPLVGIVKVLVVMAPGLSMAENQSSLQSEINKLEPVPMGEAAKIPDVVYTLQERKVPLRRRLEVGLGGANHFRSESFVDSSSASAYSYFHVNGRLALGAEGRYFFNRLSEAGSDLIVKEKIVPEIIYPQYTVTGLVAFNAFYGKLRISSSQTLHYDQFWIAGPSWNVLSNQSVLGAAFGGGFAFWLHNKWSTRIQLVDYYHQQVRRSGPHDVHDWVGSIAVGGII